MHALDQSPSVEVRRAGLVAGLGCARFRMADEPAGELPPNTGDPFARTRSVGRSRSRLPRGPRSSDHRRRRKSANDSDDAVRKASYSIDPRSGRRLTAFAERLLRSERQHWHRRLDAGMYDRRRPARRLVVGLRRLALSQRTRLLRQLESRLPLGNVRRRHGHVPRTDRSGRAAQRRHRLAARSRSDRTIRPCGRRTSFVHGLHAAVGELQRASGLRRLRSLERVSRFSQGRRHVGRFSSRAADIVLSHEFALGRVEFRAHLSSRLAAVLRCAIHQARRRDPRHYQSGIADAAAGPGADPDARNGHGQPV